jgi:iron complex transport system ATP-binding protein
MTLAVEQLAFGYSRGEPILRDVSARFEPGRIAAILGPNGAGKSTLLRAMLGLLKPWSGRTTLGGEDIRAIRPSVRAARLAFVPQRPDAVGGFTARQMIALGRHALRRDDDACKRAVDALEIEPLIDRQFARLSVGQQQRVALARALAQLDALLGRDLTGAALLADEPFSAMDPRFVGLAAETLKTVASRGGAVVLVLHDATTALRLVDDALLLTCDGTVGAQGPSRAVLTPARLAALFGAPFEAVGPSAVLPVLHGHRGDQPDTLPDA